jgi:autotransporter-associated beta strand protein
MFYKSGINGATAGGTATFTQTGGTVNAWGGITFGLAPGTIFNSGVAALTNSGGFLYIGPGGSIGITKFANSAATNYITLSGGTVGALGAWISSMPMTLATLNGNITFRTADSGGSPFNIGLSGALTGPGGFYKTGGGVLTLSGANNYAGSTVISNGMVIIKPVLSPTNGALTLDGSAGSPTLSMQPQSAGQFLTVNGSLTYAAGTVTNDFNFGSLPPSASVAPIQVTNNVVCTVMPLVTIEGSAIPTGTYPLIKYGGSVSGTLPTTPTSLPASTGGYITNITATKTIALVVTNSPVTASLVWSVGSGAWGLITNLNWSVFGNPTNYTEPNPVQFDDTASGPFPITVTNIGTVSPSGVSVPGTNTYTIIGNGGKIAGSTGVTKSGSGTLTLSGTNTYSGGTTVAGGQLNINNGGDSSGLDSAIGTGTLTLDLGAKVDNTSGQSVTLQPAIPETWVDDWNYLGSANFDTGLGAITLGSSVITLNVVSNMLAVSGAIGDGGNSYKIQKTGNGTLTLSGNNTFAGGFELVSGQVNVGSTNCLGTNAVTIDGGTIDNVSGANLTLSGVASYSFPLAVNGTFTYLGTSNNLDLGSAQVAITTGASQKWNIVSNKLTVEGNLLIGNATITKIGNGTLAVIGSGSSQQASFIVNQGEIDAGRSVGVTFGNGGNGFGFIVQSNAVVKLLAGDGNQVVDGTYIVPQLNTGGVFDLNGQSETVDGLTMTNGVLRNASAGTVSTLTITPTLGAHGTNAIILGDVNNNNTFNVPTADAELDINGAVTGSGSLLKTGLGVLKLLGNNSHTGNTTISNGVLALGASGSLAGTPLISVGNGATFDVSAVGSFTLGSSQTLSNLAAATGTLNGNLNTGSGKVSVTYVSGTPALNVTNGTLTLSGSTTFVINNSGSALAPGSYKIISKATTGNAGSVTGTLPSVTVSGGGAVGGTVPLLTVVGGELYLVVDQPVAATMTVQRTAGLALKIALSDMATNWSNASGYTPSLAGINLVTTNAVNLQTNSSWILYTNSPNVNDQISYTISDSLGTTSTGVINVVINGSVTGTNSITHIQTGNPTTLTAYGIPGFSYITERSTNLTTWVDIATNSAAANGVISVTDNFSDLGGSPPSSAYYQLKWQP